MSSRIPDTHGEAWALLPWLANGRIESVDREWVEAHVASCAQCRAELAAQRQIAAQMSRDAGAPGSGADEQKSFDKLWSRIEASESLPGPAAHRHSDAGTAPRVSRAVRWLVAAVVLQAVGLGALGVSSLRDATPFGDDIVTVADAGWRPDAPAVRIVFAPGASMETVNTLLTHQGLSIVAGPGIQGNFTAVLSEEAVAAGASADSVAQLMSRDPNVRFAQPIAR